MQISFDKNPEQTGVHINKNKLIKETYKNEDRLLLFIIDNMQTITQIKGAVIILGTLTTTVLATTAIIAVSNSLLITAVLMLLLVFSSTGAFAYGIASLFDMAIVNREKFIESVIGEIEKETETKLREMEDQVITEIMAKASTIPGLEGLDLVVGSLDTNTGETSIKQVVRAKKEKKPIKN